MKKCLLCGRDTMGSVGKAGLHWSKLCQVCKDREDDLLLQKIERTIRVVKEVEKVLI